ncbi:SDR family NAD(P)-dependent oxidoreductase [Oleisolibacter albus]|uniref:SDR family NAD(P)-dependent oxidoreductase n=1 Tax=Oleisolibacter albus TaxID=2171757 RepID=UPI000DF1B418|nr:SDR family oxidoreductase [Oleisolibacter albus]
MSNPLFDLTGKVALITGSSRGIGRSIAEEFARVGAKVVISSRKQEACDAVRAEIEAAGGEAIAVPCNIGRKEELERLVRTTLDTWGRIDVLVANAAINPVYGPLAGVSDEAWDKIMGTNLRSTWQLCNLLIPGMVERKDGSVIILSSIAGLRGNPVIGAYGVSKAAEAALVRNLAVEHGRANVRVNAIAPGIIETDFAKALTDNPDIAKAVMRRAPLGRFGTPVEIAGVALMLAGAAGRFVTGQVIVADGGATIGDPTAV